MFNRSGEGRGAARRKRWLLTLAGSVTLVEALDTATCIDELLLAGEVRVALVAEFEAEVAGAGALGNEGITACALHGYVGINRVDVGLHDDLQYRNG